MGQEESVLPVWIMNPLLFNYKKIFIYGTNNKATYIFFLLLSNRIEVEGFIDEELKGGNIWNKSIYGMDHLRNDKDALLILLDKVILIKGDYEICSELISLDKSIEKLGIYIYGAGQVGKYLLKKLIDFGITVEGFIDSDNRKVGDKILEKEIYDKEIIYDLPQHKGVIIAGKYFEEIKNVIYNIRSDLNLFYCNTESDYEPIFTNNVIVDSKKGISIRSYTLMQLVETTFNKEIILWGDDKDLAYKYYEILTFLGFRDLCFVSDKLEDDKSVKIIQCIEDVLYENSYFVLIYGQITTWHTKKLQELGMQQGRDFALLDYPVPICKMGGRKQLIDLNLGYTYQMNCKYPGFYILGENNENDYKIAILGGSTSDSDLYWHKSWPEIFYEKYCDGRVSIINGAIAGYNSAQELIKFIRDVIYLKPDMLIVMDGINDIAAKANSGKNLFGFSYLKTIINSLKEKMNQYVLPIRICNDMEIWYGIEKDTCDVLESWRKNLEYMYAVAQLNNIKFHAILQPTLFGKTEPISYHEASLMKMDEVAMGSWFKEQCLMLRQYGKKIESRYEFFHDFSHIFDGHDVYMDECHVYEKGNNIIAKEIFEIVKAELPKMGRLTLRNDKNGEG